MAKLVDGRCSKRTDGKSLSGRYSSSVNRVLHPSSLLRKLDADGRQSSIWWTKFRRQPCASPLQFATQTGRGRTAKLYLADKVSPTRADGDLLASLQKANLERAEYQVKVVRPAFTARPVRMDVLGLRRVNPIFS